MDAFFNGPFQWIMGILLGLFVVVGGILMLIAFFSGLKNKKYEKSISAVVWYLCFILASIFMVGNAYDLPAIYMAANISPFTEWLLFILLSFSGLWASVMLVKWAVKLIREKKFTDTIRPLFVLAVWITMWASLFETYFANLLA